MKFFKKLICFSGYLLLIMISSLLLSLGYYLKKYFSSSYFEQLLYNCLKSSNVGFDSLSKSISIVILGTIILVAIFLLPLIIQSFFNLSWKIRVGKKEILLFPICLKKYTFAILFCSIIVISIYIKIPNYIYNCFVKSSLYEDYYVPYDEDNVIFPDIKQNLITIYLESFETSNFSVQNGGVEDESYAPRLEQLAANYINFSNSNQLGGFKRLNGTDWTVAGMVAQTAGIPIYIKTKNGENHFLEGAVSLGDILEEHGYHNYLSIGSDANFGERKKYFEEHGHYTIYDYSYAKNVGEIDSHYFNWWGYEDSKLYSFSKNRLLEIAKKGEPFNFTMLTADTHFYDGYVDSSCPKYFSTQYANSFYCADTMLVDFIQWIQEQDFYENTTIVLVGDHLTMRSNFYNTSNDYDRTVFNLFIHSKADTTHTKMRDFTAFDMFPTTLAALGVDIEGDRLALGTNLFSNKETLSEEIGYEKLAREIQKRSNYYEKEILKKK